MSDENTIPKEYHVEIFEDIHGIYFMKSAIEKLLEIYDTMEPRGYQIMYKSSHIGSISQIYSVAELRGKNRVYIEPGIVKTNDYNAGQKILIGVWPK